jgi:hypothetical protein
LANQPPNLRKAHDDKDWILMGGVISISPHEPWLVAGWAYRMVMERTLALLSDPVDQETLREAIALQGLDFQFLARDQSLRIGRALLTAADQLRPELISKGTEARDKELADYLVTLAQNLRCAFDLENA